jgi:hypothetical protein
MNIHGFSFLKIMLLLFLVNSNFAIAQDPFIRTNSGIGQYGYLEKDASTTMLLNSNSQGNIYQLFARTWLNGNNLFTYGFALNNCSFATNLDQNINNYNFGANAIEGLIAYTSVHADYCGGTNSYGGNPNQTGYLERQHYIFDLSDRPSDVTSSVIQLNPGAITSTHNVVMSVKIDFGAVSSRVLQRFWIQNTGTLAENSEIANDGFKIYYEPATGSETFNGTESNAIIYGDYASNPTNNNIYGHNALNIAIPAGGLRVYVVLDKFAACLSTARTVQVSLINDGLSFTPDMDTSYRLARVGQTPAAPSAINVAFAAATTGALNGTYYIPSACFPTVATAVTAFNTFGVAGPVIFNVLSGYTEVAPNGGFNITGTGTAANTIIFQKFGTGTNPTFTAFNPQTAGSFSDGIFKIVGGDYITLDGFTVLENNLNATTTAASNNMIEFGVGIFYAGATGATANGAQNITIKNCSIDLNRTYTNTMGIYSSSSHTAVGPTGNVSASTTAGSNSNLTITGNAITDVNAGIVVIGSATAAAQNDGLIIGGTLANANTITNYGTAGSATTFNLRTGTVNGILVRNTKNYTVSYNNITSSTATTVTTIRGIYVDVYSSTPTGTIINSVSNNIISVRSANLSGDIYGIQLDGSVGSNTATTSINSNNFSNFGYTATSSGTSIFIHNHHIALHLNINNNTFTNNTLNTSGSVVFIRNYCFVPSSGGTQNVNGNSIVTAFSKSVAGNGVWFYDSGGSANSHIAGVINQNSNNFSNVTVTGATTINGWYNNDGAGNGTSKTFQNNTFSNITGGSGQVVVMDINDGDNTLDTNTISSVSGTGTVYGIRLGAHPGPKRANANIISGLSSTTTSADVVAMWVDAGTIQAITNNVISTLTASTNTGSFKGIYLASPGSTSNTITGNSISGMTNSSTGTSSAIRGIHVAPTSSSNSFTISSNTIYNLNGATTNTGTGVSCAIVGILISASTASTNTVNLNTIYNLNATSTAANSISVAAIATGGLSAGGTMNRNRIYGLTNTATGTTPFIVGFWPTGGNWTFANNMISLSNGTNTNGMQCVGVFDLGGSSTRNYYYNSITIGGSSTGTQNSVALQFNSATGTANIYNNILDMTRTGSGKNYALANLTAGLANMNCNYNILNAANPATVVATNGITDNSFTQWQATGKDANSLTEAVLPFVDIPTADLHMNGTCSSGEGAATPLAAPNDIDYDNEARDATLPDIGADEFETRTSVWNGTAWSTWNGVSFSSAIPTGNTNLEFTGNYSSPASLDGCACTVTSGNVVFNSSHVLTLVNTLTVAAAPASMTFENNSSLVQINNVANTGNITYKRIAQQRRLDYVYWSSPVNAFNLSSHPSNGAKFLWNTTLVNGNGTQGNWQAASGIMNVGQGYIVSGPSTFNNTTNQDLEVPFFGVPRNGNYSVPIYRGNYTGANYTLPAPNNRVVTNLDDNWNLLGNPYPSAISCRGFLSNNSTHLTGALFIWTHGSLPSTSTSNPFYNTFFSNYNATDYVPFNLTGNLANPNPDYYIGAGQGFFVTMIDGAVGSATVNFTNSLRDKTYVNATGTNFFKSSEVPTQDGIEDLGFNRIWIDLVKGNLPPIRTMFGYVNGATMQRDNLHDAISKSDGSLKIYSLQNDESFVIQGRALPFEESDQVPIGMDIIESGDYKIALAMVDGVFSNLSQNIYLEDKYLNIIYDLRLNPYSFYSTAGKFNDRFVIRYTNTALSTPDFGTLDNSVVVSINRGEMSIKSYLENIEEVTVYDVLGRQLFFSKAIGTTNFVTSNITMSQQNLIVKIKLENGVTISRKIIL